MIIKFIIGSIIGWVVGSLLIAMLTTLRFNIPSCNALLKNKEEDEQVLKRMRKNIVYLY